MLPRDSCFTKTVEDEPAAQAFTVLSDRPEHAVLTIRPNRGPLPRGDKPAEALLDWACEEHAMDMASADIPQQMLHQMGELHQVLIMYGCAIREVQTKLDILTDEFRGKQCRSPIDSIKSRVKKPRSIARKLASKGLEVSVDSAVRNLNDLAGVRVVCPLIDDIYFVADSLLVQEDITLIERDDYIAEPKPTGYRSLHLVVEVPVFFSDRTQPVRVEVQIRTIAMNFWACLEEEISYKQDLPDGEASGRELKECADIISNTDARMQNIRQQRASMDPPDRKPWRFL